MTTRNNVAKKRDSVVLKLTFLSFSKHFVLQQTEEDLSDVGHMFVNRAGKNQDVVKVNNNKSIEEISQDVINQILKDCGSIVSTNGITKYSKWPIGVLNVVF